jgi:hypothetical protein
MNLGSLGNIAPSAPPNAGQGQRPASAPLARDVRGQRFPRDLSQRDPPSAGHRQQSIEHLVIRENGCPPHHSLPALASVSSILDQMFLGEMNPRKDVARAPRVDVPIRQSGNWSIQH